MWYGIGLPLDYGMGMGLPYDKVWVGPTMILPLPCLGHRFPFLCRAAVMSSSEDQPAALPKASCRVEEWRIDSSSSRESPGGSSHHGSGTGSSRARRHPRRATPRRSDGTSHVNTRIRPIVTARSHSSPTTATVSEPSLRHVLDELAVLRGEVVKPRQCPASPQA
ncbi:hypothetical protein E2C01_076130 [Portunus trituberculatus]|uniref:Uncharacterized protein n=1 Tax=Portunus trituberculatus TaxID=210409 RepID=A0A5B7II46_PORTR|nr:hypothetical protein [Portunus trituberculatus]